MTYAMENPRSTKKLLDSRVALYNRADFIERDPVCIPHLFTKRQDIEIAGLFAAVFAWGNRTTIVAKSKELMRRMDDAPYDFVRNHSDKDLKSLSDFVHRTFQATDLLWLLHFLHHHYTGKWQPPGRTGQGNAIEIPSLESAFSHGIGKRDTDTGKALAAFHRYAFSLPDAPGRTRKHIPDPERGSSCKRLNMFLRWMVRNDDKGVDFGIWDSIRPSQLVCPLDVHVARVARKMGLLERKAADWKAALELTQNLRKLDRNDPVKYDYALFGMGIEEHY
jgi:uncharacterized protein (TIGR02757 family)